MSRKRYPIVNRLDSRDRERDLDRDLDRAMRGLRGRRLLLDHIRGEDRRGWFRLPISERGGAARRALVGRAGRQTVQFFDYVAAGGLRWMSSHQSDNALSDPGRRVNALAITLLLLWWLFRWLPPP